MVSNYDLDQAVAALGNEGLLLLATDTLWSIACDAGDPVALERLRRLHQPSARQPFELLFSDTDMLKQYVAHLHPRLETLLIYHVRPLTIIVERGRGLPASALLPNGALAARIVQDEYCRQLIERLGRPLATAYAALDGSPWPTSFGQIRSDVFEAVDYVAKRGRQNLAPGEPSVMVRLDPSEELEFLRE